MPYFTLAVGPPSSGPVVQVTDFDSWTLDNNLDDGCSLQFTARGNSVAALAIDELATDLWLYRGSTLHQRFRVTNVNQEWGPNGEDNISIGAACYRRLLKSRHVRTALTYTATSQGTIVWNLVQHAQAATGGNLGITLGSAGPVILRDRTYVIGANIFDSIVEMTQIDNGITWNVDPLLQLVVSQPSAYPVIAMPCELGVVALRMARPSSADLFGNAAVVTGDSMSTTPYLPETTGLALDPRGRWERYASLSQVKQQTQLIELGDGLLEESISPVSAWRIEMEPTRYFADAEYVIGDIITVVQPRSTVYPIGVPAPTVQTQVISRNVSQTADGLTTVVLTAVELP
jgi:hypothetical protein